MSAVRNENRRTSERKIVSKGSSFTACWFSMRRIWVISFEYVANWALRNTFWGLAFCSPGWLAPVMKISRFQLRNCKGSASGNTVNPKEARNRVARPQKGLRKAQWALLSRKQSKQPTFQESPFRVIRSLKHGKRSSESKISKNSSNEKNWVVWSP